MGDSTHGTEEFYRERARISRRLIGERGFRAVAIEADPSETQRLDRFVRGEGEDRTASQALSDFRRFPQWMWRNVEFATFAEWLRSSNLRRAPQDRTGVYGLDLLGFFDSMDAVVAYLDTVAPSAAMASRRRYACFAPYQRSDRAYGVANRHVGRSCESAARAVLALVRALPAANAGAGEAWFGAVRHAETVVAGEAYARAVYAGAYAWNLRERSMADAIDEIERHVHADGRRGGVVVWAHTAHAAYAKATDMPRRGETSAAELLKLKRGPEVFTAGLLTRTGQVLAANRWGAPPEVLDLPAAQAGSVEDVLHRAGLDGRLILSGEGPPDLRTPRPQRAVGAVYRRANDPQTYGLDTTAARAFDALIFFDSTHALRPIN